MPSARSSIAARRSCAGRDPDRIRIDRPPTQAKAIDLADALHGRWRPAARGHRVDQPVGADRGNDARLEAASRPSSISGSKAAIRPTTRSTSTRARTTATSASCTSAATTCWVPTLCCGYLAQFDQADEVSRYSGGVSASGWMAGLYERRFGHGIVFDGRASWGTAQNLPTGTVVDTTSTNRSLVRGASWRARGRRLDCYAERGPELCRRHDARGHGIFRWGTGW